MSSPERLSQTLELGINSLGHDTSAAIIKNGEVLTAIEEERLTREKHCHEFPMRAIELCLKRVKADIKDIDCICVSFIPSELVRLRFLKHSYDYFPKANKLMLANMEASRKTLRHEEEIRERLDFQNEIYFCRHHLAHLASSYYLSPFKKSALLSIDGVGEYETTVLGIGVDNKIEIFKDSITTFPFSIGLLYSAVTDYLGFLHHSDEGKVMGLAAYGDPKVFKNKFEQIVGFEEKGKYRFDLDYFAYPFEKGTRVSEEFIKLFGPPRVPKTPITQRHKDIAAGLQYITEKLILHVAKYLYEKTKLPNLCLAGGVALNCVANSKILAETPFRSIFIPPAPHDAGCAIGAVLYYLNNVRGKKVHPELDDAFLGPEFSTAEVLQAIKASSLQYRASRDIAEEVATYLAEGKIVGWFQGRMEFGPRALGGRSILAAPFPENVKDILNQKVKHREVFRPFAPSVLREEVGRYFIYDFESPFMLFTFMVKEEYKDAIPAVVHVDGTSRVQTVSREPSNKFYRLIKKFKELTGLGVILNTSFNLAGEPIVCTPEEAIRCFKKSGMDYLAIHNYILEK